MEKAEQRTKTLEAVRWLAPLPALVIYIATNGVFADWISIILVLGFFLFFSGICNAEKKRIVWENIVKDIRNALNEVGQKEAIFEVKTIKIGMVVRVYLVKAKQRSAACSKAIVKSVSEGWYRRYICATQIIDLHKKEDLKDAKLILDDDLLNDMKEKLEERRRNRKK